VYALRCQGGSAHFFGLDSDEWSEDADIDSGRSKGGNSSSTRSASRRKQDEHGESLESAEKRKASTASVHFSLAPKAWHIILNFAYHENHTSFCIDYWFLGVNQCDDDTKHTTGSGINTTLALFSG
jgi:hypothetical protein